MAFDPTQPFEVVEAGSAKPPFDPSKPFEAEDKKPTAKPPFDPSAATEPVAKTAQEALQIAVENMGDHDAREAAWQAFRTEAKKPVTMGGIAKGTAKFFGGAIPGVDEQGNLDWPLGSALYGFGKGIASTVGQEVGTVAAAARETAGMINRVAEGDTLTHAIAATPDDLEGQRLSRQLGAGVQSGALDAGRQIVTAARNVSAGANAATGGLVGTQEKDLSDEDLRKRFDEALNYHYAQAQLGQGKFLHEIAQQPAAYDTGLRTTEELAAAGKPVNPEQLAAVAGTTSPINALEIGGITNPLVKRLAAPALRAAGRVGEVVAGRVENAAAAAAKSRLLRHGTAEGALLDTILTGGSHLPIAAGAAAAGVATWLGAKTARAVSRLSREAGDEMLGAAPPIGQGFFRKTLKAGIAGTAGSVPTAAVFSLGGETPEQAGDMFWSILGIGGQMGALHGAAAARATEARAVYDAMSRHGQTVSYGDATDAASQALSAKLHPSVQGMVNYWRGSFDGATTPDGKPIRVETVDGDTFRKRSGQDSRGSFHYRDGVLTVKIGETVNGKFIPTDANRIAETFAHEGKHAIDAAMQSAQPELYKAVTDGLRQSFTVNGDGKTATPEFLDWIQGQMQLHLENLHAAGASEGQIKAALDKLDIDYWLNEASADIGQGLITGAPLGTFAATPGVVGAIGDAVRDLAARTGVRTPSRGALDLPASQRAIKLIRRQLYRAGEESRKRMQTSTAPDTLRARMAELEPVAALPITAATTTQERARIRTAQRELAEIKADIAKSGTAAFPAAGPSPTAPSKPSIVLPTPTSAPGAFRLTEAIGDARRALLAIIPTGSIKHEWMGTRIEDAAAAMTAEGIDTAAMTRKQLADELLNRAMGTKPAAQQAPQPAPAAPTPAAPKFGLEPDPRNPGFFYVIDAAGNRVDNQSRTEAGARQSARMLEQGNTGGFRIKPNPIPDVPDIIDAIIEQGGIHLGKMTAEEQEKLIPNPYLRRHLATDSPNLTPDEVARLIAPTETERGHGDGTQEGLADLITDAYRVRQEGKAKESPEDAQERYFREQAEKAAAENPNEPAEPTAPEPDTGEPIPPGRTAVLAGEGGADSTTGPVPIQATPELGDLNQIAAKARDSFLADKPLAKAGKNKGQHTAANRKAADKAAFDAVAAAHAATVPLNYQGLRQRIDGFGRATISGTVDPSRPFDAWLIERARASGNLPEGALETLLALQDAIGTTVTYDYGHAEVTPEGDMPTRAGRAASQAENTVAKRLAGESAQQTEVKTSVPLRVTFNPGADSFTVYGASHEKLLNNFNHLAEKMAEVGIEMPFRDINDPRFVAAFKAVIANHEHGWKGDGSAPAVGTVHFPVTVDPAWATSPEHQIVPKAQFDFINALLGNESMKSDTPQGKAKAALANENQIDYDPTGEANELRHRLNAASPEVDGKTWSRRTIEDPLNENISPALATSLREASHSDESIRVHGKVGDLGRFFPRGTTPNRDFSAAAFMPEDSAQPATPRDKARARMADREGVLYQGEANGLVAFKDRETNGNFSLPTEAVTPEAIREAAQKVRDSFKAKDAIDTPEKLDQWMRDQGIQFMPEDTKSALDELGEKYGDRLRTTASFDKDRKLIKLDHIQARKDAEKGTGSAYMEDLTKLADENGLTIALQTAVKSDLEKSDFKKTTSQKRLKDFYGRFGFKSNYASRSYRSDLPGNMHREPRSAKFMPATGATGNSSKYPEETSTAVKPLPSATPQDRILSGETSGQHLTTQEKAKLRRAIKPFDIKDPAMGAPSRKVGILALGRGVWMTKDGDIIPVATDHNESAGKLLGTTIENESGDTSGLDAGYAQGWARVLIRIQDSEVLVSGPKMTAAQKRNLNDWALMHNYRLIDMTEGAARFMPESDRPATPQAITTTRRTETSPAAGNIQRRTKEAAQRRIREREMQAR